MWVPTCFFPPEFPKSSEVFENAEKRRQMAEQEVPRDKWVVEILETVVETSWWIGESWWIVMFDRPILAILS
jgi:hypothetical protein